MKVKVLFLTVILFCVCVLANAFLQRGKAAPVPVGAETVEGVIEPTEGGCATGGNVVFSLTGPVTGLESAKLVYGTASFKGRCDRFFGDFGMKAIQGGTQSGKFSVIFEGKADADSLTCESSGPAYLVITGDAQKKPLTGDAIFSYGGKNHKLGRFVQQ